MKKTSRLQIWLRTLAGALVLLAALTVGLDMNSFVSLADSAGKITATSAKVRKDPSTDSETVGSAVQNATVSVTGQTTGSDGYTWYKVSVDGGIVGYIRSDLMEITDGSTPATIVTATTTTTSTPTTSTPDETLVEVAEVEPVSASVSGGSSVRVRQNASTTSRIVTTAQSGLALTVVGQATGTDNKEWYQVEFISNGSEVSGFIRAEYVSVSGELVPAGSGAGQTTETTEPEVTEEPEEEVKAWETYYTDEDSKWHLLDNTTGNSYDIAQIFSAVDANTKTLQDTLKENKTQQIVIIILVILAILLAAGVSFMIFKLKDMADSAYYNEVEQETLRRRTADRPVSRNQNGQKVMQTVGAEGNRRPAGQRPAGAQNGQRPAGQRPASAQNGQRPAGQRPASAQNGQRPAGQRPASTQNGQRPAGQRPAGAQNGQRPAGQRPASAQNGQRPAGQRPASAQNGQRPAGQRPASTQNGQRPANSQSAQRSVEVQEPVEEKVQNIFTDDTVVYDRVDVEQVAKAAETVQQEEKAGWQSKNFANEDEFEFQFLDWNEEEQ